MLSAASGNRGDGLISICRLTLRKRCHEWEPSPMGSGLHSGIQAAAHCVTWQQISIIKSLISMPASAS